MFEENSSERFDAKIFSNISIKFALKKCLNIFCSIKVFFILFLHIHIKFLSDIKSFVKTCIPVNLFVLF